MVQEGTLSTENPLSLSFEKPTGTPLATSTTSENVPQLGDAYSTARERLYLPQLDGLRTLAFLLVFAAHAGAVWPTSPLLAPWMRPLSRALRDVFFWYGWSGVDLFLVLSAFLITTILIREEQQFGNINPKLFFIRRILRIWPVDFLQSLPVSFSFH